MGPSPTTTTAPLPLPPPPSCAHGPAPGLRRPPPIPVGRGAAPAPAHAPRPRPAAPAPATPLLRPDAGGTGVHFALSDRFLSLVETFKLFIISPFPITNISSFTHEVRAVEGVVGGDSRGHRQARCSASRGATAARPRTGPARPHPTRPDRPGSVPRLIAAATSRVKGRGNAPAQPPQPHRPGSETRRRRAAPLGRRQSLAASPVGRCPRPPPLSPGPDVLRCYRSSPCVPPPTQHTHTHPWRRVERL
jgi:hypothetical protein